MKHRPITQSVKERIELILIEEMNKAEAAHIDLFVIKASNKLLELFMDELQYNAKRFS